MARKNKNRLKSNILDAALRLMNKYGYGSLTLSELAREANITKQRLYYHFPTPEDVLMELAKQWSQTGQSLTVEELAKSPYSKSLKVLSISDGMFKWMNSHFELSRLGLILYQTGPHVRKLSQFMSTARNAARERIKLFLTQDPAFADMSKSNLENVITELHATMYGYYFYVIAMNDFENLKHHRSNCNLALKKIILGHLKQI